MNRRFIQVAFQFILFFYLRNFTIIQLLSFGSLKKMMSYTLFNKMVARVYCVDYDLIDKENLLHRLLATSFDF